MTARVMTKNELRKWVRERKRQFSREELDRFSLEVSRQVLAHESWLQASLVLLYNSLPDEVDTHLLIQSALEAGKQVLLPVVVGDELELRLYSSQMRQGAFGILEPEGDAFQDFAAIDLAIVPGMAFDASGHRLGRGRGYYDRLLQRLPHVTTLGICFPFQLVDAVPAALHDISVSEVIC